MKKIIFTLMSLAMLSSCEGVEEESYDTIKTSVDAVTISDENPIAEVTTVGGQWAFDLFEVDEKIYPVGDYTKDLYEDVATTVEVSDGYVVKISPIDGFMQGACNPVTEISCDWVTITRSLQKITIAATDNDITAPKTIKVQLWDRSCSEYITITRE